MSKCISLKDNLIKKLERTMQKHGFKTYSEALEYLLGKKVSKNARGLNDQRNV